MMSNWGNMKNQYEYAEKCFELVASLYASFIHQMASQIEAVTVLVLSKQNAMYDRFDRNTLYATAVNIMINFIAFGILSSITAIRLMKNCVQHIQN